MPHWRTLMKQEWFCAADLWDERADKYATAAVKIVKVTQGEVVGKKGRKKGMPFLWLEDRSGQPLRAPFGANSTNATTISQVLGTEDYKKWIGQWIGLYVTKVDGPDGKVDGIRINPKPVPDEFKSAGSAGQKPTPQPDHTGDLSEADKRAIELAEAEEAKRRS